MKDAAMDTTAAAATTNWTTKTSTITTTTTSEQNSEIGAAGYLNADQTLALMADLEFSTDQWSELGG